MDGTPTNPENEPQNARSALQWGNTPPQAQTHSLPPEFAATGPVVRIRDSREIDSRILVLAIHWHYTDNSIEENRILAQIAALQWVQDRSIEWGEAMAEAQAAALGYLDAEGLTKRKGDKP